MSDTVKVEIRICPICGYEGAELSCPADGAALKMKGGNSLVGKVLKDRYRIIEPLGTGGMGAVYKAQHLRLQTSVAVKVLDTSFSSEESEQYKRFQREGQVINGLVHPNIVRALDFDLQEGKPFLVMDYVNGQSLQQILAQIKRMPAKRAVSIFVQIADALGYAHSSGILHRDLKPGNVMLTAGANGEESVKLLDFGLAKLLDPDQANRLTQTGMVFGTPLYMSPEQCLGNPIDQRSDIYSLGCLMYETLAGKPPLQGSNSLATLQKQIHEAPLTFQQQGIKDVPPPLVAVVMQALEKSPENRQASMPELRRQLERALLPSSVAESQSAADEPVRKSSFAKIAALIAGLVACAAIAGGLFMSYDLMHRKPEAEPRAVAPRAALPVAAKDNAPALPLTKPGNSTSVPLKAEVVTPVKAVLNETPEQPGTPVQAPAALPVPGRPSENAKPVTKTREAPKVAAPEHSSLPHPPGAKPEAAFPPPGGQ